MVDVRDRDDTVAAIRRVRRRFERGAPPPLAAVELLEELRAGLADSGPFEVGGKWTGNDGHWTRALEICQAAIDRAESGSSRRVRSALAALEAFFADSWWWRWRSDSTFNNAMLVLWAPLTMPLLVFLTLVFRLMRAEARMARRAGVLADPASAAVSLELPDRLLLAIASDRRLIVATDRGIVIATGDARGLRVVWQVPYREVVAKKTSHGSVTIVAPDRSSSYPVTDADLLMILQLRAPEALSDDIVLPPAVTQQRPAGARAARRRMRDRSDWTPAAARPGLSPSIRAATPARPMWQPACRSAGRCSTPRAPSPLPHLNGKW